MAANGELPMPDAAIFADTQAEPASVYQWLEWLEDQLPYPVIKVTAGNLAELEMELKTSKRSGKVYRKSHIPAFAQKPDGSKGIISRKCTADFKIRPITKWVRANAGITRGQKHITVTQWIGISWDEIQRMKEMREPWQQARWPLIERRMSRRHCKEWMKENGYPEPPRSACLFCPFHDDHEWRRLRDTEPKEFEKAIEFEKRMQEVSAQDETATSKPTAAQAGRIAQNAAGGNHHVGHGPTSRCG